MNVYLLTLLLAAGIALVATVLLQALSKTRLLTGPFGQDAAHRPKLGGVALFLAFAITPFLASAISSEASELFAPKSGRFLGFLGACSLVFLTGLFDDWRVASWQQKLIGQIGAGVAVYAAGYRIEQVAPPWGGAVELGLLAPLVTIGWVVFFTNAINLVDGKDGVAAGVSILAATRRALDRSHPFEGDEDHIHHRLEVLGLGPRGILAVLYSLSVLFSGAAILLHYVDYFPMELAVLGALLALVAAILTKLGYAVSLWNSHGMVWLRRKAPFLEPAPLEVEAPARGDGDGSE